MNSKKIYQIKWTNQALRKLHQLVSEEEAKKIKELVKNIFSQDPYNELRYIERKIRPNKHIDIKRLEWDWESSWRLRYKKYRIVYEIWEEKITINVFKFGERLTIYNHSEDDTDFPSKR